MNARALVTALGGRWWGRAGNAPCPCCQPEGRRDQHGLSVSERGGRLLIYCHKHGCHFLDILATLAEMGLAEGIERRRTPDPEEAARRDAGEAREAETRIKRARHAWAEAGPIAGTLGERYLRARAIRAELPASLRFNPACWHESARRLPAMVAAVTIEGEAEPVAVHRTYLAEPGQKADVEPNKAMLGPVKGAAVRLADGPGPLIVAEGIETALSALDAMAAHRPRAWAALSAGGLRVLRLPAIPGDLIVAPDAETIGTDAAHDLAERAEAAGWRVSLLPPPAPHGDWNDWARARREAA